MEKRNLEKIIARVLVDSYAVKELPLELRGFALHKSRGNAFLLFNRDTQEAYGVRVKKVEVNYDSVTKESWIRY